jgi:hypothetical protein
VYPAAAVRRSPFVLLAAAGAVLLTPGPALAQDRADRDDLIVLQGSAEVPESQTVDTVVVFDGSATIDGAVESSVVAFNAPVTISGSVGEDVVSFSGTVTVRSGGSVGGDVVSRTEPVIEEGATIGGEIRRTGDLFRDPFPFWGRIAAWLAVSVSTLLLGVLLLALAPRAADGLDAAWRSAAGATVGWGLLLLVGLPLVAILAFITIVGIPFGFGLAMALFLIYALGYTTGAWLLGRRLVGAPRSRFLAFLVGLGILRLVALVPIVAGIVGAIAAVLGLGAIAVAIWRARRPVPATA